MSSARDEFLIPADPDGYQTLRETLGMFIVCVIVFVYLPLCIYGIFQYNRHKQWIVMKKRYQWITVFMLTNLVLSLLLLPLLLLWYSNFDFYDNFLPDAAIPFILYAIIVLAINIAWKILWRLWCYYFDIKWTFAVSNKQWKSLIDDSAIANDWFLNNKTKYGKWNRFVVPYFMIVFLDIFLITMWEYVLPSHLVGNKYMFVFITIFIISSVPICSIAYLRWITPAFNDNFAIREETKRVLLSICFGFLTLVLIGVLLLFVSSEPVAIVCTMTIYFIWSTIYTVMVYLSTIWVIRRNAMWLHKSREESIIQEQRRKPVTDSLNDDLLDVVHDDVMGASLTEILGNSVSYSLFIQHLLTEFNVECCVCLTELVQFQQLIALYCDVNGIEDYRQNASNVQPMFKSIRFDEEIPRSKIVYAGIETNEYCNMDRNEFHCVCKQKVRALYEKYIKFGSDVEIDVYDEIGYDEIRETFALLMENKEVDWMQVEMKEVNLIELMYLYENVCHQMYLTMIDSYHRFVETSNYKKLSEYIEIQ